MITKLDVKHFTAFENISIEFSKGINVFIGENGTGKTHILKMLYAAYSVADEHVMETLDKKVDSVFLPNKIGRLVKRAQGRNKGSFQVWRQDLEGQTRNILLELTTLHKANVRSKQWQKGKHLNCVYIPVKDMLANAPGFRSLYATRNIHFESIYADIVDKALLPAVKGQPSKEKQKLLTLIQKTINGKIFIEKEQFYLKNKSGNLEFTLLAEGYRKLGLLYTLIQNETLSKNSILFWDEPEANLNPKLQKGLVNIILALQKMGVQVFIATHDYVFLKELDLATEVEDDVMYHVLYHQDDVVMHGAYTSYHEIKNSAIADTYVSLLEREIGRSITL